ncbi:LysR family transcriptional regulator [Lutibaculum baratangense]|uniref:Transcriptional regulator n=1 Tax=Lutibaculum baratangense AMV1 TaxID=631454 RepID=V4TFB7_9HYPH|nr:LysR family transcriptional regulator [Lutibaculum baratangense]ESR24858.1 Transcriptional regulator [Lutibaculum baratangense AMV1]
MRFSGSDLRLLQVFDAVVRNGGFSAAEAELNIASSTISNHMTALEQRLGIKLCQRGRVGFALTEKGRRVHEAVRRLFRGIADFEADTEALRGRLTGELRIGLVDSLASDPNCRLTAAIARFKTLAPYVSLQLVQERPQELQARVHDGTYHCGFGSFPHTISGLDCTFLYEEAHFLYIGRGHPLFTKPEDQISRQSLQKHAMVRRGYWREQDHKRFDLGPVEATVHQIEPQLMLVMSGRYVGFLPDHVAKPWIASGDLREILRDEIAYVCRFELVTRTGHRMTEVLRSFIRCCSEAHRGPASARPEAKTPVPNRSGGPPFGSATTSA